MSTKNSRLLLHVVTWMNLRQHIERSKPDPK